MKKKLLTRKCVAPNQQNLPFTEYYQSLPDIRNVKKGSITPRMSFLKSIAEATGKSHLSIRRWAYGTVIPAQLEREAVAKLLNSTPEILFPDNH